MLQMTRRGAFLGICLIFFISAWMFVLGVLVGRGTAPVHFDIEALQKELIALKESILKQEEEKMKADAALAEKKRELDFYEALKGSKQDEPLKIQCQHFLDCIKSGDTPISGAEESLRVVQILEASSRSLANEGNRIEIERLY